MSNANFCPACGELLPPLPVTWRVRSAAVVCGRRCPACGHRLPGLQWKTFGGGLALGLVVGLGNTVWYATQPPPPLPALTTQVALGVPDVTDRVPQAMLSRERHRCGAKTKKGTPCQRWVSGTTGYCWQHRSTDAPVTQTLDLQTKGQP